MNTIITKQIEELLTKLVVSTSGGESFVSVETWRQIEQIGAGTNPTFARARYDAIKLGMSEICKLRLICSHLLLTASYNERLLMKCASLGQLSISEIKGTVSQSEAQKGREPLI
jgi:hypothetical protein